ACRAGCRSAWGSRARPGVANGGPAGCSWSAPPASRSASAASRSSRPETSSRVGRTGERVVFGGWSEPRAAAGRAGAANARGADLPRHSRGGVVLQAREPPGRDAPPMLTRVHHVGLVVRRLEDGLAFWRDGLGLHVSKQATVLDQGVKAALLPIGRSEIELLEPVDANGGVAKFLEKRGEGLHHVCFETPDVGAELAAARAAGFPLIDE